MIIHHEIKITSRNLCLFYCHLDNSISLNRYSVTDSARKTYEIKMKSGIFAMSFFSTINYKSNELHIFFKSNIIGKIDSPNGRLLFFTFFLLLFDYCQRLTVFEKYIPCVYKLINQKSKNSHPVKQILESIRFSEIFMNFIIIFKRNSHLVTHLPNRPQLNATHFVGI